jgi:hypothetical protein
MNSELRKWLFALGVLLSSCSFALGFLPAADRAEVPAESAKDQEETLYLHRPQLTSALSHSPLTIQDSHWPFAIHYSPHTGAFLVTPAVPASANLSPHDFNQVSASIFDPVNNAIRINASLSPGGTHTPNDANQVFTSIFDSINNAIYVNCVVGCPGAIGGLATAVQFNNSGSLGGDAANFFYNTSTHALGITGAFSAASIGGLTGAVTPNAAGGTTIGSAALPFSGLYVGGAATNNTKITGTMTAPRVLTLPDANSNTVQPSSASSAGLFATGISSSGVISYLAPMATVNVANDSPGSTSIGSCTITLTNASNTATASSSNCFSSSNVGTIIQYNSGTPPNFRAVIIGVSGTTLTLGTYFPGATTGSVSYASGLTTGTYNSVSDYCGQINASILNHAGTQIDASAVNVAGNSTCTMSPWNSVNYTTSTPGGRLQLGSGNITTTRPWVVPGQWDLGGYGKAATASNMNTNLAADSTNFPGQNYEANAVTSTNVVTTSGTKSFADTTSTLVSTIASTSCIGGTNYGIITLSSALTGFVESNQIHIAGITGNTGWNGIWMLTAVSGLTGTVNFPSACPTTGTLTNATADLAINDLMQGSFVVSTTNTASGSGTFATVTSSASDFTATDVGSCTVQCTGAGCGGHAGPYTIVAVGGSPSATATLKNATSISWTSQTYTKKCWIQSTITGLTSYSGGVATFLTNIPMQQTINTGTSVTYSIGGAVVLPTSFGASQGSTIQGINIHDMVINASGIPAGVAISMNAAQEQGSLARLGISGWTGYGIDCEINCAHNGPWMTIQGGASNSAPPTAAAVMAVEGSGGGPPRMMEAMTWLANTDGSDPYACFEISTPDVLLANNHCEQFAIPIDIGRYNGVGHPKGVNILSNDPGIGLWEGIKIWASTANVSIAANAATNAAGNASTFLEDDNFSATCGSGTTLLTDASAAAPGIAMYILNTSVTPSTRFSADPEAANCLQGTSTGLQCFATACGGSNSSSPTLTLNMLQGNHVAVNLAAAVTTLTVNNSVTGQDMDLTIQENATGGFGFTFPSTFKGFSAITTTANQCNVYHAMFDGTNWVATAGVNSFAGPCL